MIAASGLWYSNENEIVNTNSRQLQKKYKHAKDFGIEGDYSPANARKFNSAINKHINAPETKKILGTFKNEPVMHFVDPRTGLNVITDRSGNFISGWKLNPIQLENILNHGGL